MSLQNRNRRENCVACWTGGMYKYFWIESGVVFQDRCGRKNRDMLNNCWGLRDGVGCGVSGWAGDEKSRRILNNWKNVTVVVHMYTNNLEKFTLQISWHSSLLKNCWFSILLRLVTVFAVYVHIYNLFQFCLELFLSNLSCLRTFILL